MKKILTVLAASLLVSTTAQAFSEDEVVIWLGGDKAYQGLVELGKKFENDTGIRVKVENPENITDRFQQAAGSGQGPDIIFWAHDRIGGWADGGLLKPINPSENFKSDFVDKSWAAMSHDGKTYGYPVSLEAISLVYNKDIIPEPPVSFEEMFELDKKLSKKGIDTLIWAQTDPYFTFPFVSANGGYVFKQENGVYDTSNTGINNAGAKKGAKMITDLIEKDVSPRGADFSVAEARFAKGKSAMIIAGPWSWANYDKVGMNYGVAAIPEIGGNPAKPFVGVWGALVNNASPNEEIVQEFMENYVMTLDGLQIMNRDVPLGVVSHKEFQKMLGKDPRIAASAASVENGLLMPSVPEMGRFWSAFDAAMKNIVSGRDSVDGALNTAAKLIVDDKS